MASSPKREVWFPYQTKYRAYSAGLVGLFTFMLAIFSVCVAAAARNGSAAAARNGSATVQIVLVAVWGIWPPAWFLFEHYFWFDNWDEKDAVKRFQDGQKLWAKLWAGVGAILVVLFKSTF